MRVLGVLAVSLLLVPESWAQSLTRGPYLQLGAPTGMTIVFRTDRAGIGRVRYGLEGQALSLSVTGATASTEHVLRLTNLAAGTRYAYALELDGLSLATTAPLRFRTHPIPGVAEAFRLFAWGDSGTAGSGQIQVANRMANELNGAAFAMILGDIIYPSGEPQDYDPKYFRPYAQLTSRMVVWPVIGNHDVGFDPTGGPFIDAFHTPANNPISTELYYSFDYANAHIVVLDTHVNSFSASSAQMQWAAADLAASTAMWKIAAFHVPPYTGGTHTDSASVKAGILPILEAAGVDLVFAGHSHVYERTYLLKQNAIVQNDRSDYTKPAHTTGTLYVVSGTAGQSGSLSNPTHPMMAFQLGSVLGTSVVDFTGNTVHGYFLKSDGTAVDAFRLSKGTDQRAPTLVAARSTSATSVEAVFDEPVLAGTGATGAERVAAWTITPPIAVTAATLATDLRTVRLTTAAHPAGTFTIAGTGVGDRVTPANLSGTSTVSYSFSGAIDAGQPLDAGVTGIPDGGVLFVGRLTPLTYFIGASAPPAAWNGFAFDDSLWSVGRQPIGYGESGLATTVTMGQAATLFTRSEFDLFVDPSEVRGLTLEIDYDDGFVAYLNGQEIARRGVATNHTFMTFASGHESGVAEVFPLANAQALLRSGDNFLSIEVHNTALTSSDLFLNARLWANAVIIQSDAGTRPNDDDAGVDGGLAVDAGQPGNDSGVLDAGVLDAGGPDAGAPDAGPVDAGLMMMPDSGTPATDAGQMTADDAGSRDAGTEVTEPPEVCGCSSGSVLPFGVLALLAWWSRRRPRHISASQVDR